MNKRTIFSFLILGVITLSTTGCPRFQDETARYTAWLLAAVTLSLVILAIALFLFYLSRKNGKHLEKLAAEAREAKELAERGSRYKSNFLAIVSHEIRTPMNAIMGISEIQLQKRPLLPDTEEAFKKIYEAGDLLLYIINDILDLSKIEAGKLELVPVEYNLLSMISATMRFNAPRNEKKSLRFTVRMDENTPIELCGDEFRVKQVLNNILSNAFKYTEKGEIEFAVSSSADGAQEGKVIIVFSVSDTGVGMTKAQAEKLFEELSFDVEANRTTVGVGMGMSIVKNLVDLMGGNITVKSEPDKGSVFTVSIPQKQTGPAVSGPEFSGKMDDFRYKSAETLKKTQSTHEYMPYGKVLVVDDMESNLYVIKGLLEPYGLKIDTASSGFQTIEKIKNGSVYDIVFMDYMMPKMDGIETVKNMRGMGYAHCIVALTTNTLIGQADMFLNNGFDGFISKPIDTRELNKVLIDFVKNKKKQL